jgi:hypothetical protein
MIELKGKYNTAKVFTDNVEQEAISQIITLLNQEFAKDSTIRNMPDTHAGAGCTIGTTMTIHGKVVPCMVGAYPPKPVITDIFSVITGFLRSGRLLIFDGRHCNQR